MTGCASEDAEVDELGEEEDLEPPELYSGDVSRAGRLPRLTELDTSPEYSSGGSSSSSSPSSSTSLSSSAHPVTRDECPGSHPVGPRLALLLVWMLSIVLALPVVWTNVRDRNTIKKFQENSKTQQ